MENVIFLIIRRMRMPLLTLIATYTVAILGFVLIPGQDGDGNDLYQVNCTFYDALGRSDARYLAARTIQLVLPGFPQIYYVGLLAGENDGGPSPMLARDSVAASKVPVMPGERTISANAQITWEIAPK